MPATYKKIQSVTVTASTAAAIEFTSIPGTYTDLVLKLSLKSDFNADGVGNLIYQFNASTSGYSVRQVGGFATSTESRSLTTLTKSSVVYGRAGSAEIPLSGAGMTANTFSSNELYIPNYAGSTNKSFSMDSVSEINSTTNNQLELTANLWSNTAAITSITLAEYNGNLKQYSTATLYGILKA